MARNLRLEERKTIRSVSKKCLPERGAVMVGSNGKKENASMPKDPAQKKRDHRRNTVGTSRKK